MKLLKSLTLFFFLISCSAFIESVFAQGGVSINPTGANPDSSAALDIDYPEKGLLVPRMTTTQRNNISSPELSLLIFNTTDSCFQAWSGNQWENIKCFGGCQTSTTPSSASASPSSICPGNSTTLSVSGGSLGKGASWEWYTSSCGGSPVGSGPSITVTPTSDAMYYVRAESSCNITSCASTMVSVKSESTAPTSASASPSSVCPGNSSTLTVTGGSLGTGASWNWYASSCGGSPVGSGSSINVSPGSTTIYYVRGEGDCNQTNCVNTSVTVNTSPSATASSNSPVCEGNAITLSTGSYNSYNWSGPNGFSSTVQNPTINNASPSDGGTYSVTVADGSGCSATASTNVTVNTNPKASAGSNSPLCEGEDINLTATASGGSGSGYSYSWSGPNGYTDANQNPVIANAGTADAGTYNLTVTDGNGCSATASTTVTINANPSPSASSNSPVCQGDAINLSTGNYSSYTWNGPNGFSSNNQNPTINNASSADAGTYNVTVTNGNNCSDSASTSVTVNSNSTAPNSASASPNPVPSGSSTTLSVSGGSLGDGASWTWYQGSCGSGSSVGTGSSISVSPTSQTTYYVRAEGTCNTTSCASVTVDVTNSLAQMCAGVGTQGNDDFIGDFDESMIRSNNGNYVIAGRNGTFGANPFLAKVNGQGSLIDSFTLTNNSASDASAVVQTDDDGFAVTGTWNGGGFLEPDTIFVLKLDNNFNVSWLKTIQGSANNDRAYDIIQTNDGGYAVAGETENYGPGSDFNTFVVKLDQNGNLDWHNAVGASTGREFGRSIIQTNDNGFAIAGRTTNLGPGIGTGNDKKDMFVFKLNNSGSLQWSKGVGGQNDYDEANDIIQSNDGNLVLVGRSNDIGVNGSLGNAYVVKLDQNGIIWNTAVGSATDSLEQANSVVQTTNGDLLVAGESASFGNDNSYDMYVFQLNNTGSNLQLTKTVGATGGDDDAYVVTETPSGFTVAGQTVNFGPGSGSENFGLVKFDNNNNACCSMTSGGQTFTGGTSTSNQANAAGPNSNISTISQTPQTGTYGTINLNCSQN